MESRTINTENMKFGGKWNGPYFFCIGATASLFVGYVISDKWNSPFNWNPEKA